LQQIRVPSTGVTLADIKQVIKDTVAEELAALRKPEVKELTLLQAVGAALSQEDQVWLSDPARLQGVEKQLPLFFQSEDGRNAIKAFVKHYRQA